MGVLPSYWKIAAIDASDRGIVVVTLKSGVILEGRLNRALSQDDNDALHLTGIGNLSGGFHTIEYEQIAAITRRPSPL